MHAVVFTADIRQMYRQILIFPPHRYYQRIRWRFPDQTKLYAKYINSKDIYAWSDSTVALSWIKSLSHRWKTFVCNRVTQIQEHLPPEHWCHVYSGNNPVDCASHGVLPFELVNHPLWWADLPWLQYPLISGP